MLRKKFRPTAVIAHPLWGRGGAEIAAAWIIVALSRDFDVTVYTRGGFDAKELAVLAGIDEGKISCRLMIAKKAKYLRVGRLEHAMFIRSLTAVGASFDLRVTASGVLPWGNSALHFISSAIWHPALANRFRAAHLDIGTTFWRRVLIRISARISQEKLRVLSNDRFVANSMWTAAQSEPFCPGPIDLIYPTLSTSRMDCKPTCREEGFLVFGRISPEKRIEDCVKIVQQLRQAGHPVKLCIAGPNGDKTYSKIIDAICAKHEWIERKYLVTGNEKLKLLRRFRYGLSACDIEAFGIATAEMAAARMIVFVPEVGGQREIIGDKRLIYSTLDDAVEKILMVVGDPKLRDELIGNTDKALLRFSSERFIEETRRIAIKTAFGTSEQG